MLLYKGLLLKLLLIPGAISEITSTLGNKYNESCHFILVGHYHQTGIYETNNIKVIFMGDWLTKFTVTTYDGIIWSQKSWDN